MKTFLKFCLNYLLMITLFISRFSYSQKPAVGLKAGMSVSKGTLNNTNNYRPNSFENRSAINGILFGVYVDIKSGKKLIFRPGVELVPKGVEYFRYSYLDFPLNILYKVNKPNGAWLLGGGPTIGTPLNGNNRNFYGYNLKPDFGVNGLIGYEFAIGFSLNLNYTYGLINASKEEQSSGNIKNRYLGITAGYTF